MKLSRLTLAAAMIGALPTRVVFFDGGKSEWKKTDDGKGIAVDANGNPIWIDANGGEVSHQADTITRLNGEAATLRKRAETAESKAKEFDGIDPTKAREALETVGKFKQGELITAGKVDEVRTEITKSFEGKISEAEKKAAEATDRLNRTLLQSQFVGSKFGTEKLAIPADVAQSFFGNRFKVDGDKVIGMKADGSGPIYSKARAGEVATFDEAFEYIVDEYANKAAILKGGNNSGSGNNGGGNNGPGGKRTVTRSQFDAMGASDKAKVAAEMREGKAEITG